MKKSTPASDRTARSGYHHGDLKRSLLDAALELVAVHGVQGFTLREAARVASVSHNAPYRHFSSRDHLLVELAIEGQSKLLESLKSALVRHRDPRERIVRLGVAYVEFAIAHTALFRVMFSSEVARHRTDVLVAAQKLTFQYFESELLASEQAGLIRPGSVSQHALAGWSALHGAAILHIDGVLDNTLIAGGRQPQQLARLIIDSLLTGIMNRDETHR